MVWARDWTWTARASVEALLISDSENIRVVGVLLGRAQVVLVGLVARHQVVSGVQAAAAPEVRVAVVPAAALPPPQVLPAAAAAAALVKLVVAPEALALLLAEAAV